MSAPDRPSLRAVLAAHGGALGAALAPDVEPRAGAETPGPASHGDTVAAGPRAEGAPGEYALLVDMIDEGSRLHYGGARVIAADEDLGLLLGDQLYALGLQRLATLGDLDAVRELADVISLVAQAHAEGDPERAEAAWMAGAVAIGWGRSRQEQALRAQTLPSRR